MPSVAASHGCLNHDSCRLRKCFVEVNRLLTGQYYCIVIGIGWYGERMLDDRDVLGSTGRGDGYVQQGCRALVVAYFRTAVYTTTLLQQVVA